MTLSTATPNTPKLTYSVVLKKVDEGYTAAVLGWADCNATGSTFAGMFAEDQDFEAVQADIAAYRQEIDAQIDAEADEL
jgi:hypothetical protein